MKRIANITEEGRYGGLRARIAGVAARLKGYGVETAVVCPEWGSEVFRAKLIELGVETKRLPLRFLNRQKAQTVRYVIFFVCELFGLFRYLRRGRFDGVYRNGSYQIKGVIAGKLAGARVIWHLNDTRDQKIIRLGFRVLARYFCDGFIFAGRRVRDYYVGESALARKPCMDIQAPVDTKYFCPDLVSPGAGAETKDALNIVTVANINPAKGLEYFVEMAKRLNESQRNIRYFVVGGFFESQRRYYERLQSLKESYGIDNRVFEQGVKDVRPFLRTADIYVCSSVHEASPMFVWEAMGMEKLIVSTDVGDVGRYIRDGEDGFIVPLRDARALAEKMEILIQDESLRKQFASRVRKIAVENFDVDICARKHAQAYQMVKMSK